MCLDRITNGKKHNKKFEAKKFKGYSIGYKIFVNSNGQLKKLFQGNSKKYKINTWLNEKDFRSLLYTKYSLIKAMSSKKYKAGFHIFVNPADCYEFMDRMYMSENCVIRKVLFRNVLCRGFQLKLPVIVSQEIKILPIKREPIKPISQWDRFDNVVFAYPGPSH